MKDLGLVFGGRVEKGAAAIHGLPMAGIEFSIIVFVRCLAFLVSFVS